MSLEKHVIELAAKDTVSPALKQIATNADNAGKHAEQAAQRATRSSQDWSKAAANVGKVLGGLGAVAIKLGNESQVAQTRLEQSIENTGESYGELEDKINAATKAALAFGFDDEDAINSISQLTDATGSAEEALTALSVAQDIARGRGISLAAATDIVQAAEQGRYGALKRMGIVIDDTATKEEALGALHAKYAGQAEAYATTNAASWDRMGNAIENKLETIGGTLADFQGPLVALGGASQLIGPLGDAFESLGGKAKISQLASSALASSWIGPVGLVAAAGLAGVAIYKWAQTLDDTQVTAETVTAQVESLSQALAGLGKAGVDSSILTILADTSDDYERLGNLVDQYNTQLGETVAQENALNLERANSGDIDRINAIDAEIAALDERKKTLEGNILTESEYQAVQSQSIHLLTNLNSLNADVVIARYKELWEQFAAGTINADDLAAGIDYLDKNSAAYGLTLAQIAQGQKATTTATVDMTQALYGGSLALAGNKDLIEEGIQKRKEDVKAIQDQTKAMIEQAQQQRDGGETDYQARIDAYNEQRAAADAYAKSTRGANQATLDFGTGATAAAGYTNDFTKQIEALNSTLTDTGAEGLSRTMGMVVGYTNSIVSATGAAKDWADSLIGPRGQFSEMDNLYNEGKIGLLEYVSAQLAQEEITRANTRATDAANVVQVKQASLIADQADAAADYIEKLAGMSAGEEQIALAYADPAMSSRITQITDMAAGYDDMTTSQQEAFTQMITSAAAADPALAAVLTSLGLIKADVNEPTGYTLGIGVGGQTEVDTMNNTLDIIAKLLGVQYGLNVDTHDSGALARAGLKASIDAIGAGAWDTSIGIGSDAGMFWAGVAAIPDSVGTRYIDVYERSHPSGAYALGGTAKDYDTAALGRMGRGLTLVGENGPEMVTLPHGSIVTPNHATRYADKAKGSGGDTYIINIDKVLANDPQAFLRQTRQLATTMERR